MSQIKKEIKILNSGGVLLHKTDTIWGLACDAINYNSIKKIYSIKKRELNKPLIILVNNFEMLKRYVNNIPIYLANEINNINEPSTIIYSNPKKLPEILIHNNTIAIRITKNIQCKEIINSINKPIVSTSANISGDPFPRNFSEISDKIKKSVDYILKEENENNNTAKKNKPSKLFRINDKQELEYLDR